MAFNAIPSREDELAKALSRFVISATKVFPNFPDGTLKMFRFQWTTSLYM